MFVIYAKVPMYDGRDGFCGSQVSQAVPYAYETVDLAHRMVPSSYDEEGQSTETTYFVADSSDPWRRPIARPAREVDFEDIPF